MIWHCCQPIWDEFFNAAAREGLDNFPTSTDLLEDRRAASPVEWQRPEQPWVDPEAEQKSAEGAVNSHMSTLQEVVGSRGGSWRSVLYQQAKERKLRMELGLLNPEEQTAQMMAAQTGSSGPLDAVEQEQAGTGEWMGLTRLQMKNNDKALNDILNGLADGTMRPSVAKAKLSMIGMKQQNIDAVIADVSDGTVDNPMPVEEVAASE